MEKKTDRPAWPLLVLSAVCLVAGWLIFAPLLFFWFAFLLRAYDILKVRNDWRHVYSGVITYFIVTISLLKILDGSFSVITAMHATLLSVPFVMHYHTDGYIVPRFSRIHIVFFWFALQYIFMHVLPSPFLFFIADAPSIPASWVSWNIKTGFLGISLWIFIVNGLIYRNFPPRSIRNWIYLTIAVLIFAVPVIISREMANSPLTAQDMLLLYQGAYQEHPGYNYSDFGEIIARTAAWISVLVIIFTLVKIKTRKH